MTMITPSYLGETIEYSSLHACRSTLEDPTWRLWQRRGGQDPNPSGQPSRYHGPVKGKASVRVLHPSMDADGSRREVIRQGASACTTPARGCSQSSALPKNCSATRIRPLNSAGRFFDSAKLVLHLRHGYD